MNSIGTAWVFVLLVIINLDIGGRAIFNHPIRGVPEIVAMSIVACVFLQIAHTLKVGRLTRSDMLMNWIKNKHPGLKNFLEGLYYSIGAGFNGHYYSRPVCRCSPKPGKLMNMWAPKETLWHPSGLSN